MESEEVVAVRKIRIYPKEPRRYWRHLHASRRAYNLAIAVCKDIEDDRGQVEVRREIRGEVSSVFDDVSRTVLSEAVDSAFVTKQAIIRKRIRGEVCDYQFRSRKNTKQSFVIQRLASTPLPKTLGEVYITEAIPEDSFGRMAEVIHENGRWFLCVKFTVTTESTESQGLSVVAVDPGVRTFATTFSSDETVKIGEDFSKELLYPLARKLDQLYSQRKKFQNGTSVPRAFKDRPQWYWDRVQYFEKRIFKLKNRMRDLTDDLHRRAADWLTKNYDVILLPTFEVKGMTKKQKRKIRSKTVRQMLTLSHYRFKVYVKWIAKKRGKRVVDVNEAYTSKTDSRTGEVQDIGGATKINGLDRDTNGARGILLRALTRQLEPQAKTA